MSLSGPDPTVEAPLRVMHLSALSLIRVSGADTDAFLQGQLSSDLRRLSPSQGQLSSYSSPKGRMLAVFYLNRWPDGVTLEVHQSVAADVLARLRRFVMRSKVTLEEVGASLPALGVSGERAAAALQAAGLVPPALEDGFALEGEAGLSRRRGRVPRFVVRAPVGRLEAVTQALAPAHEVTDDAAWRRQDIEAGVPCVYPQTSDHFIAQMANLDLLGGISFDKGCFTGQEVIARLHYLGSVKRRLGLMLFATPGAEPGAPLFDASQPGQPVGEIADVAPFGEQQWLASAVLQVPHLRSPGLHLGTPDGPRSGPVRPSLAAETEA